MAVTAVLIVSWPVEDHDLGVGHLLLGLVQDVEAADLVHHEVGQDDVEVLLLDEPEALAAAGGDHALVADAFEALGHGVGVGLVIVDDQDADRLFHGDGSYALGRSGDR